MKKLVVSLLLSLLCVPLLLAYDDIPWKFDGNIVREPASINGADELELGFVDSFVSTFRISDAYENFSTLPVGFFLMFR